MQIPLLERVLDVGRKEMSMYTHSSINKVVLIQKWIKGSMYVFVTSFMACLSEYVLRFAVRFKEEIKY